MKLPAALLVVVAPHAAVAQPFVDVANVRLQHFPNSTFEEGPGGQLDTEKVAAELFVPIELESKHVILVGAAYEWFSFRTAGSKSRRDTLAAASLQLGGVVQWVPDAWNTMFILIPKIASDFEDLTREDFQLGGAVLVTHTWDETLKLQAGLYYNREFFGNFFMPLGGIEWRPTHRLYIYGVLPGSLNAEYRAADSIYVGASYRSITASYRLSKKQNSRYVREGDTFWGHDQLYLFLNAYVFEYVVLYAELGHTAWRKYDLYDDNHERVKGHPIYRPFRDRPFVALGATFRVRLDRPSN